MKPILLALLLVLAGQKGGEFPPPGNPGHVEPPKGMACEPARKGVPKSRACDCKPTCMENRDGNGEPDGTWTRQEDVTRCRSACFKDRCNCGPECGP